MSTIVVHGPSGALHVASMPAPHGASGSELPALFVHGLVGHTGFWEHTLAHAARHRRAFALDLRGHGRSAQPADGDYSVEGFAADVAAVLDALQLERVALVGHSFGAFVALAVAAGAPARVARLVLADPPGDFTKLPAEVRDGQLAPFVAALEGDDWRRTIELAFDEALTAGAPTTRDIVRRRLAATPRDALLGVYRAMFRFDAVAALDAYLARPHITPRAILAPANAWSYSLHVLRPALAATVLPDVGHWLMLDAPTPFGWALDEALKER
ncbi:MAG: alpha/beta fold hydrolase [Gemmatimonadaceae bacterium]